MPHTANLAFRQPTTATRGAIVALLVKVLRPLVIFMLRHGMSVYEFTEISRWLFAHAAMDPAFAVRNRDAWSMTKSRAAVLTGLTRREVDRLVRMHEPAVDEARETFHRGARVLAAWKREAGYQDAQGRPRDLAIKGEHGSLEWLVRHYCRDIPLRAMVDELLDRCCIVRPERNVVRFVQADIGGPAIPPEDLEKLARQAGHFMELVERGLADEAALPCFIEVAAGPITAEHREALRHRLAETMDDFAAQVKRDLSTHPKSLMPDSGSRMIAGFYNGFL